MLLELVLTGIIAYAALHYSNSLVSFGSKVTDRMLGVVNNGPEYRDVTFSTMADYIQHPDMLNNHFSRTTKPIVDLGVYGVPRMTAAVYPMITEPMQLYRTDGLTL